MFGLVILIGATSGKDQGGKSKWQDKVEIGGYEELKQMILLVNSFVPASTRL